MDNFWHNSSDSLQNLDLNSYNDYFIPNLNSPSQDFFKINQNNHAQFKNFQGYQYKLIQSENQSQLIIPQDRYQSIKKIQEQLNLQSTSAKDQFDDFKEVQEESYKLQAQIIIKKGNEKTLKKKKTCDDTKNLLINFRSFFVDYIKQNDPDSQYDPFIQNFQTKKSVNRTDYEQLFKNKKYKSIINEMFQERFLQRQFQLSRSSSQIRGTYLKKIPVFKRAFELEWFPRIR